MMGHNRYGFNKGGPHTKSGTGHSGPSRFRLSDRSALRGADLVQEIVALIPNRAQLRESGAQRIEQRREHRADEVKNRHGHFLQFPQGDSLEARGFGKALSHLPSKR